MCNYVTGKVGRIVAYVRQNNTCPANDFLNGIAPKMRNRFAGQFDALTKIGGHTQLVSASVR